MAESLTFSWNIKPVRKAVVPAAGLGTRFLPATKAIPKEMIPIIDIPMIQYIVEEAVSAGIEELILVTAPGKEAIERHFSPNPILEESLKSSGKKDLLEIVQRLSHSIKITKVYQDAPRGLGHAVLCAEKEVGDEPFAVLLPDDLVDGDPPCIEQLVKTAVSQNASVIGVMEVAASEVSKYGIVGGTMLAPRLMKMNQMVEKPKAEDAPSRLATPGRYVFSPTIFECIRQTKPGKGGEIQLTDAIDILLERESVFAYQFKGTRYDTGDRLGYIDATIAFALKRPELREHVQIILRKYLESSL